VEMIKMVITSITAQEKNSSRYNIYIDYSYSFSADYEDIIELGIKEGMVLDDAGFEHLITSCQYKKALNKAILFLSARARSEHEIKNKLMSLNYDAQIIEKVICRLKELKYIDDMEFAMAWIKERKKLKPQGTKRIIQELKNKGVNSEIIDDSLAMSQIDDLETAIAIVKKKMGKEKIVKGSKEYAKIYRHLIYRGINYNTAQKALNLVVEDSAPSI